MDLAIYRRGVRYTPTQKAFSGSQELGGTITIAGHPEELRKVVELCLGDLTLLRQRGERAGVARFLDQIEALLYPLFLTP